MDRLALVLLLNMYSDSVFLFYVSTWSSPTCPVLPLRLCGRLCAGQSQSVHLCIVVAITSTPKTKLFRGLTQLSAIQMLFLKSYYKKKKYVVDMYDYKKQTNKETRRSLMSYPWRFALPIKAPIWDVDRNGGREQRLGNLAEWLFPTNNGKAERLECFMQIIWGNSCYYMSGSLISMSSGQCKFQARWTFDVVKVWRRLKAVVKTLVVCQNHHLVVGEDILFFLSIILEEKKPVTFNPVCCCSVRLWV